MEGHRSDIKCPAGPERVASVSVNGTRFGASFVAAVGNPSADEVVANTQIDNPASSTPHIS